jgi:hydrogenase maturation protease
MSVLVLGIGNLIMSDDSVGVRLVQRLQERYRFPEGVSLHDGGTLGPELLPLLEGVEKLLVVDAVETGNSPGTVVRLAGEDIPLVMGAKLSPHQLGLTDLLAIATLRGVVPQEIVVWGIQPENLGLGLELSPAVASRITALEIGILQELRDWNIDPVPQESAEGPENTTDKPQIPVS